MTFPSGILDVLGIGFGPANIALAIAHEELSPNLKIKFLEKNPQAGWQDEMLLPESDIQNHPLRDLVTPRNPTSKYSFTNFLFTKGRLFEYLNLPIHHPLRIEYRQYVVWVAEQFSKIVNYNSNVNRITPIFRQSKINHYLVETTCGSKYYARSLVIAPGRTPNIPEIFLPFNDQRIAHLSSFLSVLEKIRAIECPRVAIVGGSQTAVELILHLENNLPNSIITSIHRNFGFRLKDTSPFSDEVYFPEFVDMYFNLPSDGKNRLRNELVYTNYSSADRDVIDELYVTLYRNKILDKRNILIKRLSKIQKVSLTKNFVILELENILNGVTETVEVDYVILATGFKDLGHGSGRERIPRILDDLADFIRFDGDDLQIGYDYKVELLEPNHSSAPVYLNGLCESSHGMGDAGSFSLLSLRSELIINSIQKHLTYFEAI